MAYTSDDLAQVRQAILALAAGTRVARITYQGKTIEYGSADMDKLVQLEAQIAARLSAGKRRRTRLTTTTKGL